MTHAANFGGAEISLLEILERLDRDKIEPVFMCLSDGPLVEAVKAAGVPTHVMTASDDVVKAKRDDFGFSPDAPLKAVSNYFKTLPVILKIMDFIEEEEIDVVYTNSTKAHVIGGFAGKKTRRPVIWHFRDYPSAGMRIFFGGLAAALARVVVCNSEFTASQFHTHPGVCVVHNGIPGAKVRPGRDAAEVRAELGIGEGDVVLGTAGRLDRWKGIHLFVQAAAKVAEKFDNARFVVAGGSIYAGEEYLDELKKLAKAEGVSEKFTFTGFREDIYDIMNIYNVYVHPSEEPEPFGRGIVEAMLLEKPVVASAHGGPLEIVLRKKTGLFFRPGEVDKLASAMISLLEDPDTAAEYGTKGCRRAELRFSIGQCVDSVTQIILEQPKPRKSRNPNAGAAAGR